jgi:mono/diheme cytochrome c family protein
MTPREAADRLFNRVMMATEQGNAEEARQFAPMALLAYGRVDDLDADARYHMGHLYSVAGEIENARKEIAILKQAAPHHLLALLLEHTIAEQSGDRDAAAAVRATFAAAYAAEMKTGKPEYEAHRTSIESLRTAAAGAMLDLPAPAVPAAAPPGATLFADKCGGCHGQNAAGSDKGPPLVHKTYEPSHHADESFYRAVRQGVKSHHWPFGDMLPIKGVSDEEIGQIIAYVRALQVANGIR